MPVVASSIRGYAEWLEGAGVGETVPPGDVKALGSAIRNITIDQARYAECARRARILAEKYDWAKCADRLIELYSAGR